MVFLKDQWRAITRERKELDTYRRLHQHGVQFIATPIAGEDIDAHRTSSQMLMKDRLNMSRPIERIHSRLVTKEVGRPLKDYKDSVDLIQVVSYAVIAHRIAWEKAKILHNNVSAANIMINAETDEGFLNDWDLCKFKEDLKNKIPASQPGGGTWPFKSALSLMYPTKPAEVADDLESFIYIILLMAMRFHRHELASDASLDSTVEEQRLANSKNEPLAARFYDIFYEEIRCKNGYSKGGQTKHLYVKFGKPPIKLEEAEEGPTLLERFLRMGWTLLRRHYKHVNFDDLAPYAVAPKPTRLSKDAQPAEDTQKRNLKDNSVMAHFSQKFTRYPRCSSPSVSSNGSSGWLIREERPLDKHDALCWLFDEVFRDKSGNALDLTHLRGDKFFDMCAGQPVMTSTRRKNLNGTHSLLPFPPPIEEVEEEE
ncbi:uncharacterized protein PHACADRAFT_142121 [Phanerochaete carnosa HHB-10118-sp]|uniref:Fungal-type protein kinase domain-containing protein n=1 Tax=Phanerochaete carnosa (strain HHB-10118-sp) TaxID=650164 RepID=K5WDD5_PHACS|nr:uncharacterized protein PHACADRAFT_142121 [Phanerochaete carnosa HHB-10118-sp]EKM57029.1 hypothetical protein PHACADRAFT_142121 [Phanerochaete carnosa HHB-10118-sp]